MKMHVATLTLGLAVLAGGCSLTIDRDALAGPNCTDAEKQCEVDGEMTCVQLKSPDFGCAQATCAPCYLNEATATCGPSAGECIVAACIGSWENCDRNDANGCEVDLNTDPEHCGGCGQDCPARPQAEMRCGSARCYIRVCEEGFLDCNDDPSDGCETNLALHPGGCEQ